MPKQDTYTIMRDVQVRMERLEDKLDSRLDRVEERIGVIEGFRTQVLVVLAITVFSLTFLKDFLISKVMGYGK